MRALGEEIKSLVSESPGEHSLYLKDLVEEKTFLYRADEMMPAASLIKVPVLYELLRSLSKGEIGRQEKISITRESLVSGAGILAHLEPGVELTFMDLGELMITISDNTATNLIIERLGMESINTLLRAYGLTNTKLCRLMMDREAREKGLENVTTAREMGVLMELLDPAHSNREREKAREILCRQQFRDNLSYLIPGKSWSKIASKTGVLRGIEHDATFFLEPSPMVVVAMAEDLPDNTNGKLLHAKLGRLIYQYLQKKDTPTIRDREY